MYYVAPAGSYGNCSELNFMGVAGVAPVRTAAPVEVEVPPLAWAPQQRDAAGFTIPSSYAISLYVDSSAGSDTNPGTVTAPLKTLTAAYKRLVNGAAIYLKRGCTWNESFPGWWLVSCSALLAYGPDTSPLPLIVAPAATSPLSIQRGTSNVIVQGITFRPANHDPSQPGYVPNCGSFGIQVGNSAGNVLIEGCNIQQFYQGICVQGSAGKNVNNVMIRRCVIADCHTDRGNPVNIYANFVTHFYMDETVLDRGGWMQVNGTHYGQPKSDMVHNFYGNQDDGNGHFAPVDTVTVTNSIIARGAGNGLMLRMGGDISGSLFIANGMQGRDIVSGGQNPTVTGNVFVGTADQCLPQRTGGITIVSSGGNYEKNIFANQSVGGVAIEVDNRNKVASTQPHPWNMTITANTVATTYSGGIPSRQAR